MISAQVMAAHFQRRGRGSFAALACVTVLASLPLSASASERFDRLLSACAEGRMSLQDRAEAVQSIGFTPIESEGASWVQGQVAHIAMSVLVQGGDVRANYALYAEIAAKGDLFAENIEQFSFTEYAHRQNICIRHSLLSPVWDNWIDGKRLTSGFMVISQ